MSTVSYREFTGTAAENYQAHFVPAIATPVSEHLMEVAALEPGERVLDVACGTGAISRLAAAAVAPSGSVTGVDISPDMLDVAKHVGHTPDVPIAWTLGDAASLDLPDAAFDVVLCQMGLMFMDDRAAATGEMRRVLAEGGRVVCNTPGRIQPVFAALEEAIVEHIDPGLGAFVTAVFSLSEPEVVAELLRDGGFRDVTVSTYTAKFRLAPPEEFLWQYINLTPMQPFVARAPRAATDAMEREFAERVRPYVIDGATIVEQPMVIATSRA
jgi:ubiquinone/menaquinone biosynthesis C-methylase UbiE